MGTVQLLNTLRAGYKGVIYPVHPKEKTVRGLRAYAHVSDLPKPVDTAILTLPTKVVPWVLEECGQNGIRHAIIISGGFKEVDDEGKRLEKDISRIAKKYKIRFIGPNCIGVINPRIGFNPTMFPYLHHPGGVGLISQSGTYVTQVLPYLARMGIGFSKAISVGNMADLDISDCLEYLSDDTETKCIALYIEEIREGQRFLDVARRTVIKKPVVALYTGGTSGGAKAAVSHTGSMAGNDMIYDNIFRQAGIIRVYSVEDLFEWAGVLACQPLPKGPKMAILTHSGGPATSMADACTRHHLQLPEFSPDIKKRIQKFIPPTGSAQNPIDMTFVIDIKGMMADMPRLILKDPNIDGLLIHGIMGITWIKNVKEAAGEIHDYFQMEQFIADTVDELASMPGKYGKPIICSSFIDREEKAIAYMRDHNLPNFTSPEKAVRAMAALYRYSLIRKR